MFPLFLQDTLGKVRGLSIGETNWIVSLYVNELEAILEHIPEMQKPQTWFPLNQIVSKAFDCIYQEIIENNLSDDSLAH